MASAANRLSPNKLSPMKKRATRGNKAPTRLGLAFSGIEPLGEEAKVRGYNQQ